MPGSGFSFYGSSDTSHENSCYDVGTLPALAPVNKLSHCFYFLFSITTMDIGGGATGYNDGVFVFSFPISHAVFFTLFGKLSTGRKNGAPGCLL